MKNMKKFLVLIFVLMVLFPTCVFAAKKKNLVNVYVFGASDCPYCTQQIEYLKGLSSYNKKFKIVEKSLYSSIHSGEIGDDYKLGTSVASLFYDHGFTDASATGTPFMIISDLYAATGYYTADKLEEIIDQAYKAGDKDVVKCVESGKDNCLSDDAAPVVTPSPTTTAATTTTTRSLSDKEKSSNGIILIIILGIIIALVVVSRKNNNIDIDDDDEDDSDEDEDDNESEDDDESEEDDDDESEEEEDDDESEEEDDDDESEEEDDDDESEEEDDDDEEEETREVVKAEKVDTKKTNNKNRTRK